MPITVTHLMKSDISDTPKINN